MQSSYQHPCLMKRIFPSECALCGLAHQPIPVLPAILVRLAVTQLQKIDGYNKKLFSLANADRKNCFILVKPVHFLKQ